MSDFAKIDTVMRDYPEISGFAMLWHSDYYDGYISGMIQYENNPYWFSMAEELFLPHPLNTVELDEYIRDRLFFVYRLTDEQYRNEYYWHELFEEHVGTHTSYDKKNLKAPFRRTGVLKSRENHHKYYDEAKKNREKLNLSESELVGWFLETQ